jgi:myo-inositol 2-dehydrogenase/D-chiro-inositol 1-dehydrogenase
MLRKIPTTVSRRQFLKSTSTVGALGGLAAYWITDAPARAAHFVAKNDRPVVALIGCGRGLYDAKCAQPFGDVVAVCDADLAQAEKAKAALGGKARIFQDYHKMLDACPGIEAVINGTPEHWHTAINVAACRAGKDLYAEKPLTLTIDEGKILRRVVHETNRVVQVGAQQRSQAHFRTACELVRNGRIGKLRQVIVLLPLFSAKGGPFASQPIPPKLDWDLYQGQAPLRPFCPQRTHFSWRFWSEYGGGKVCDWGQHHLDIAHWGMGIENSGPTEIDAKCFFPNRGKPDCYNNADRFVARMKYPNDVDLLYLVVRDKKYLKTLADGDMTAAEDAELFAGVSEKWKHEQRDGIMFVGDKGHVFVNRGKAYGKAVEELAANPLSADAIRLYKSDDHMGNFFECIKSRKPPISTVDSGLRVITACHLVNVSMHLKRKIHWNLEKEEIVGDSEASNSVYVRREQRKPYIIPA